MSTEGSTLRLLRELLRINGTLYHIQFEYRTFGGFAKSILLLPCLSLLLRIKRPVIVSLHGVITIDSLAGRRFKRLAYMLYLTGVKLTALFAEVIIVPNELMRTVLHSQYRVMNVAVIPLGIDPPPSKTKGNSNSSSLIFYGFVRPSKGVEKLILALDHVLTRYPNVKLTIAGGLSRQEEATYLCHLEEIVRKKKLDGHVEFISRFLGEDEKNRLFSQAAAIVLPYTDRFIESSGVVHDFACYGIPFICTRIPRFSELVDGFDCIKVDPTPIDIANAILKLLSSPELGPRLASNLRSRVNRESWDVVANKHLELYRAIAT